MNLTRTFAALAAFATTALLFAAPASAQATRTWVSGVGDDANPCSRTAPCKTFAGSISKTSAGGEIDCLDPGGFGALTITKSITIDCEPAGQVGGVLVAGTNGITVNAASTDTVQLIGLDFDGLGGPGPGTTGSPGLNGVSVLQAGNVAIIHCTIYGFTGTGAGNGSGVNVAPTGSSVKVYIGNSVIRNNNSGVTISPGGGLFATVELDHDTVDNAFVGASLVLTASGATAILTNSTLTGGGISNTGSGSVVSYGNNVIRPAGGVTQTLSPQ